MNRDEVLNVLRAHKATLAQRFGVTELSFFGSFARDRATDDSDLDILVRFNRPATSDAYFGTQFYLEDLLGHLVDLVDRQGPAGGDMSLCGAGNRQCLTRDGRLL